MSSTLNGFVVIALLILLAIHPAFPQVKNGFDISNSSIPKNEILHGGPPKDGIPSIDNPRFVAANQYNEFESDTRVLAVRFNGVSKAYPIKIMNYHEIVNDDFNGVPIVVTYCPLCGSGLSFITEIEGIQTEFGVSGLLYNSDVLMYDRNTNSLWSQLKQEAIAGKLVGHTLKPVITENTTLSEWTDRHPETLILSKNTGFSRNYESTPYVGYDQTKQLYFPVSDSDDSFHPKEMVLGVELNGSFKAYPFRELVKAQNPILDEFMGQQLQIHFDKKHKSARLIQADESITFFNTFWFAWYTFHPTTDVFKYRN